MASKKTANFFLLPLTISCYTLKPVADKVDIFNTMNEPLGGGGGGGGGDVLLVLWPLIIFIQLFIFI